MLAGDYSFVVRVDCYEVTTLGRASLPFGQCTYDDKDSFFGTLVSSRPCLFYQTDSDQRDRAVMTDREMFRELITEATADVGGV